MSYGSSQNAGNDCVRLGYKAREPAAPGCLHAPWAAQTFLISSPVLLTHWENADYTLDDEVGVVVVSFLCLTTLIGHNSNHRGLELAIRGCESSTV